VVCRGRGSLSVLPQRFHSALKHGKLTGRGKTGHATQAYRGTVRLDAALRLYLCPFYSSPAGSEYDDDHHHHCPPTGEHDDYRHYLPAWDSAR
jgi:hypothetical protein